ncbi:hypothetical protein VNO77_30583 [Canavalia gladiata]|uniref:Uncharacterized protein n=1 Tax=Canavalia gladiata TaxID=3824 RepID=A0AAN9KRN4_CANGL
MEINSLSGELTQSTDNTKAIPCKHFSIRGFVAGMRQKNWKMTSPFILDESEEQPLLSLPPLVARRFRNSRCGNCVEQVKAEANCKKEESNLSSEEPQEAPMSNSNFQRIEIDLNKPIELDSDDDDHSKDTMPTNNEKQYDAKVGVDRITVYETSLENNLNQDVPNVPSSEKCSSPMQGVVHTNKRGSEGNVVSDMELDNRLENNLNHEVPINSSLEEGQDPIQEVMRTIERGSEVNVVSNMEHDTTINLNNMDKSSSEVGNEVRSTSKNNQCPTELRTSKEIIMREAEVVAEDNVIEHTIEEFPPKSMDNEVNVPPRNMDNNVENDGVLDLHKKNSIKSRRKQRKMRLLDEIFRENDEANIKKVTVETQSHSNVPLQTRSSIPDKVVTIEVEKKVTKRGKGRKGKSQPISKKCVEADVSLKRAEIEVQNIKGNAAKGKGKVLVESNKEIDNDKMVEDSLVQKEAEHLPNMPVSTANPPAPNGEELEEGLHISSINPSLGLICNNRSFPRQEFQLPWPFQEGTSTWRPIRGGGGINPFRQQHYYSKNSMDAISRKGKDVLIELPPSLETNTKVFAKALFTRWNGKKLKRYALERLKPRELHRPPAFARAQTRWQKIVQLPADYAGVIFGLLAEQNKGHLTIDLILFYGDHRKLCSVINNLQNQAFQINNDLGSYFAVAFTVAITLLEPFVL